jgi:hypothetical protein
MKKIDFLGGKVYLFMRKAGAEDSPHRLSLHPFFGHRPKACRLRVDGLFIERRKLKITNYKLQIAN